MSGLEPSDGEVSGLFGAKVVDLFEMIKKEVGTVIVAIQVRNPEMAKNALPKYLPRQTSDAFLLPRLKQISTWIAKNRAFADCSEP